MRNHQATILSIVLLSWLVAESAAADWTDLELTVPVSVVDRSVTGTPDELSPFQYDNASGLMSGLEVRVYDQQNDYFDLGLVLGAQQQAGPLLGLTDGYAFRTTVMEAGLAARALLPCISGPTAQWRIGGVLALTGVHADAGLGVGGQDNGDLVDERRAASATLDHAGLGWRLGFDLAAHFDHFLIGVGLGVRQYFGVDSPVERGWLLDLGLRIGGRIDFDRGGRDDWAPEGL